MKNFIFGLILLVGLQASAQTDLYGPVTIQKTPAAVTDTTGTDLLLRKRSDKKLVKMNWEDFSTFFSGGGGGTLQTITDAGNVTKNTLIVRNGFDPYLFYTELNSGGLFKEFSVGTPGVTTTSVGFQNANKNNSIYFPDGSGTLPVSFSVNGGTAVQANDDGLVSLTVSGGGSQNLNDVLIQGNTSNQPIIIANGSGTQSKLESGKLNISDANYITTIKAGLVSFTNVDSEYTVDLITGEPLVDGARFLLPQVTTAQNFTIPVTVNQVQPNDGGDIWLGLAEIINYSGYVEAPDGSYISLDPNGSVGFESFSVDGVTNSGFSTTVGEARLRSQNNTLNSTLYARNGKLIIQKEGFDFGGLLFDADYSATMTTDRHIPDIGKVLSLISDNPSATNLSYAAAPAGGAVESGTGTSALIPAGSTTNASLMLPADKTKLNAITGTNTGDNATNTTSNAYADAKVQNSLTASTTVAPSATAVNTGLGLKANLAGGNTFSGTQTFGLGSISITGANGIPYYTSGTEGWIINGVSGDYLKWDVSGPVFANFTTDTRAVPLTTITPTNSNVTSGQTVAQAFSRTQGQINAMTSYVSKTANYTLTNNDFCVDLTANSATFTLPTAVGVSGKQYVVKNSGLATILTLATTSSQTIDGTTTKTFNTQYAGIRVISDGANWKIIGTY